MFVRTFKIKRAAVSDDLSLAAALGGFVFCFSERDTPRLGGLPVLRKEECKKA